MSAMDILSGTAKITHEDVKQISQLTPELQKKIVETVLEEDRKSFKEVIKQEIIEKHTEPQLRFLTILKIKLAEKEKIINTNTEESILSSCPIFYPN